MYSTTFADPSRLIAISHLIGATRTFRGKETATIQGEQFDAAHMGDFSFYSPSAVRHQHSFGPITERVFWLIHAMVRTASTPEVIISFDDFRRWIWSNSTPRNWKAKLRSVLDSLCLLRIGHRSSGDDGPSAEEAYTLLRSYEVIKDPKGLKIEITEDFLGALEDCLQTAKGVVQYDFFDKKKLRQLRKADELVDVYLPIFLGRPDCCTEFTARQKALLQIIFRELTRTSQNHEKEDTDAEPIVSGEQISDGMIRGFSAKAKLACPNLKTGENYVGFNGNGKRKGRGYRLTTWIKRAGYRVDQMTQFLSDLEALCTWLGLIAGALDRTNQWTELSRLRFLVNAPRRDQLPENVHLRVYAKSDFLMAWDRFFEWAEFVNQNGEQDPQKSLATANIAEDLKWLMNRENLQQKEVAKRLGVTSSAVSQMIKRGKASATMHTNIQSLIASYEPKTNKAKAVPPKFRLAKFKPVPNLVWALHYQQQGWAVVPMRPGTKKPMVSWQEFQVQPPSTDQIKAWWKQWPDAGLAVVLGPVSNLVAIDVDGEEAYGCLMDLIGEIPMAPTVKSGNRDPFRFHLYFEHPKNTKSVAKSTPYGTPKLELRGEGGLLVLPPSIHESGKAYHWVHGKTTTQVPPPALPNRLLTPILPSEGRQGESNNPTELFKYQLSDQALQLPRWTIAFLNGDYADADGSWNQRLFWAACDLRALNLDIELATRELLLGAMPRTPEDEVIARNTIRSAYSKPRTLGRVPRNQTK